MSLGLHGTVSERCLLVRERAPETHIVIAFTPTIPTTTTANTLCNDIYILCFPDLSGFEVFLDLVIYGPIDNDAQLYRTAEEFEQGRRQLRIMFVKPTSNNKGKKNERIGV